MRRTKSSQAHDKAVKLLPISMTTPRNLTSGDRRRSDYTTPPTWMQDHPVPIQLGYSTSRVAPPPLSSSLATLSSLPLPGFSPTASLPKYAQQRPVIPSKRAAQNRAAQKAFRHRREQYIRELEEKATKMDEFELEMARLRLENKQLKDIVHQLDDKISHLLQGKDKDLIPSEKFTSPPTSLSRMPSHPLSHDHAGETEKGASPVVAPYMDETSTPMPSSPSHPMDMWPTSAPDLDLDLDLDFDPFFDPTFGMQLSGSTHGMNDTRDQVLDDLFAMLQTRQRPQIPMQPVLHSGSEYNGNGP